MPCIAAYWNVPILIWLLATLVRIPPGSSVSLITLSLVFNARSALVVGMPAAFMNSLIMYSLNTGPRADFPSPLLEKGVCPIPFNWISRLLISPSRIALPSPRFGLNCPNWCPEYACAIGIESSSNALPLKIFKHSSESKNFLLRPSSSPSS